MAPTGSIGRSLELFYVDGTAEGLVTAKTFGWIGQVLLVPRTRMAEGLKRPEAACAGVYFLLGERDGAPLAYIGESEAVGKRLLDRLQEGLVDRGCLRHRRRAQQSAREVP